MPKLVTLVDNFSSNRYFAISGTSVTVSGGTLNTPALSGYAGAETTAADWDLADSEVTWQVPGFPTTVGNQLVIYHDGLPNYEYKFEYQSDSVKRIVCNFNGSNTTVALGSYIWFRMRHAGSTLYMEASTNGTAWTVLRSGAVTTPTPANFGIFSGNYSGTANGGTFQIDNMNTGTPTAASVTYAFTSNSLAPTTTSGSITGSTIGKVGSSTIAATSAYGYAANPVLQVSPASSTTKPGNLTDYLSFTFTAARFTLDSLVLSAARGGSTTPRGFRVRTSSDGFANDIGVYDVSTQRTTLSTYTVDLSTTAFTNSLEVRLYFYGPASAATTEIDNLVFSGSTYPTVAQTLTQNITDSAGSTDAATQTEAYARVFTDTAGPTDTATTVESYWRDFTDTTGLVDTATQVEAYARPFDDSTTVTDTVTVGIIYGRDFTDTAAVTDQAGTAAGFSRTADDPAGPTDTITSTTVPPLTAGATDTATVTDTPPTFIYGYGRVFTDTAGPTDSITLTVVPPLTAGAVDAAGPTDTVTTFKTSAYVLNVTDTAAGTDLLTSTRSSANSVTIDDAAPISDSATTVIIPSAIAFTDTAGLTDTVTTRLVQTILNVTDTAGPTDTVATRVAQTVLPLAADTAGPTDQVTVGLVVTKVAVDTATVTDTITFAIARNVTVVDGVTLTDSPTSPNYARRKVTTTETVALQDAATAVRTGFVTITDTTGLTDPATAAKFLVPITGGTVLLAIGRDAVAVLSTPAAAVAALTPNRAVASATLVTTRAAVAALAAAQAGTADVEETYQ